VTFLKFSKVAFTSSVFTEGYPDELACVEFMMKSDEG
jgi:hypothetical protein